MNYIMLLPSPSDLTETLPLALRLSGQNKLPSIHFECDSNGNPIIMTRYATGLAMAIKEHAGADYWPVLDKIGQAVLADFRLKKSSDFAVYWQHVRKSILDIENNMDIPDVFRGQFNQLQKSQANDVEVLEQTLEFLLSSRELHLISQFYYTVWLHQYGTKPLIPFMPICAQNFHSKVSTLSQLCQHVLKRDYQERGAGAETLVGEFYTKRSQPDVYFSPDPRAELNRGRVKRQHPQFSKTRIMGICDDGTALCVFQNGLNHVPSKNIFQANPDSPFVKKLRKKGGCFIAGLSGTLGRNIFMIYALLNLTPEEQRIYIMCLFADLILRGHHSPSEIAAAARFFGLHRSGRDGSDLSPQDPQKYCSQFIAGKFKNSPQYEQLQSLILRR